MLARCCPEHFDIWFDRKTFSWSYSEYLIMYCMDNLDTWYHKKIFDETKQQLRQLHLEEMMKRHLI
jgi:hypothetical protein